MVAFILVLGIVVDDAIVVGERVFSHERYGKDQLTAAVEGTAEVAVPVIFGVLTTIAAFIPVIFTPGMMGQLFSVIGYVVVICLVFSVIESQLILPAHLAHRRTAVPSGGGNAFTSRWRRLQKRISTWIERYADETYGPALARVMEWRYLALSGGVGVLLIGLGLVLSGRIDVQFSRPSRATEWSPSWKCRKESTWRKRLGRPDRLKPRPGAPARAGCRLPGSALTDPSRLFLRGQSLGGRFLAAPQSHTAELVLSVLPLRERGDVSVTGIAERWRELTGPIYDSVALTFTTSGLTVGDAIAIRLRGETWTTWRELPRSCGVNSGVSTASRTFPTRSARANRRQLSLRPEARQLG